MSVGPRRDSVVKRSADAAHEARMLELARGEGVVRLLETRAGALVLERLHGPTLAERAPLTPKEVRALAKRLTATLQRLHARGIVHGDLKPENVILVDGDPARATLIDFDAARAVGERASPRVTVGYAAPERLSGVDLARTEHDVFSLGATLWAARRGRSPFDGDTRDAVMLRVLAVDPEPLEELGPLGAAILAMLDKQPNRRALRAPPREENTLHVDGGALEPLDPIARAHAAWRAAVRAIEGSELDRAEALLRDAECPPTSSVARLQSGLNDALRAQLARWRGDHAAAQRYARAALARLPIGTRAWCEALGERATASGKLGDRADLAAIAAALRARPAPDALASWDRACARAGVQLHYQGQTREARALDRLFRARTDAARRAESPGLLIVSALFAGRLDEYLATLRDATRASLKRGDLKSACLYGASVGYARAELGDYAGAERDLRRTLALAERSGLAALVALTRHNLGPVLAARGKLADAVLEDTLAIDALAGDPRLRAGSLAYRARARVAASDLEEAERDARAAVDGDRASSAGPLALAVLAEVLIARGRAEEALETAERACALAADGGPVEAGDALAHLCRVRALAALGDDPRGLARHAWRRIVVRSKKIANATMRARFLTRVPEHRATRSFIP